MVSPSPTISTKLWLSCSRKMGFLGAEFPSVPRTAYVAFRYTGLWKAGTLRHAVPPTTKQVTKEVTNSSGS